MNDSGRITKKQIASIWASARDLGMDKELLYTLVPGGSISRLNRRQAAQLIDMLRDLGAKPPRREHSEKPQPGWHVTEAQKEMIGRLFHRLGWDDNPHRMEGFLKKYAGASNMDELTDRKRAIAIIEALKAILARQAGGKLARERAKRYPAASLFPVMETGEGEKLGEDGQQQKIGRTR